MTTNAWSKKLKLYAVRGFKKEFFVDAPMADITSFEFSVSENVEEIPKSILGRAAFGYILFGPMGGLVAGATGIKPKQKFDCLVTLDIHWIENGEEKSYQGAFEWKGKKKAIENQLRGVANAVESFNK